MEDNSSSDDEVKDSPLSPKMGCKKLKLNDGTSQESPMETASTAKEEKEENVDSGVSADKSESTSSEDRGAGMSEEPSNEVVDVAPSSSNVHTILLNIRRPRCYRNYRKRKTPDRDSDSNDSSRDSDDWSAEESAPELRPSQNSNSEDDNVVRFMSFSDSPSGSSSSSEDVSYPSDDMLYMQSGDTDSDDEGMEDRSYEGNEFEDEEKKKPPPVLTIARPKHNYLLLKEIINREMGLTLQAGKVAKSDVVFEQQFYGSLHSVYRLKKLHNLNKHRGCVNSINFHPEGHLLASGSDDTNVIIWDWSRNRAIQTIKTGHKSNVFQSKFLYLNARSQLNIVTCARDGQVRLLQCPPSGGTAVKRRLSAHARAAHKLHVSAHEPHLVLSAGEDGLVLQCDVRQEHASRLFKVTDESMPIPLYSVCGDPLDPKELVVAGRDKFVRIYDRRRSTKPLAMYCPSVFENNNGSAKKKIRMSMMHLTCAVYNHDGSQILGSYNDEDIYLFDKKKDVYDKENIEKDGFTAQYNGHRNSATFKGVAFFGPRSEYVVSGSDCSHIYFWEKKSGAIVQWLHGDVNGVVNCIEPHPQCPVLATSGLDKDVKIWVPRNHKDPTFDGLERVVKENVSSQPRGSLFDNVLPVLYSAWRGDRRPAHDSNQPDVCTTI